MRRLLKKIPFEMLRFMSLSNLLNIGDDFMTKFLSIIQIGVSTTISIVYEWLYLTISEGHKAHITTNSSHVCTVWLLNDDQVFIYCCAIRNTCTFDWLLHVHFVSYLIFLCCLVMCMWTILLHKYVRFYTFVWLYIFSAIPV